MTVVIAASNGQRKFDAKYVRLLHRDPEIAGREVAADLFEVLHVADGSGEKWLGGKALLYANRQWTHCLLSNVSSP